MDYKTLRKNYRLYIRSAGLLAMLLIFCIGFVVRDTLLQTAGLLLVLAGLFLFIHLLKKSYTNKCNTLLHVDLDLAFSLTITDPTLAEKTKKVCLALYDLTIAHQSNDYFEDLCNDFKYQQLEIIYYQALNATLKGDKSRAEELFRKLVSEDESLYIVRKAQQYLKDEGNYL